MPTIFGQVDKDGNETGDGFTVLKTGAGEYTITFNPVFNNGVPAVSVQPMFDQQRTLVASLNSLSERSVKVILADGRNAWALTDGDFTFWASTP